MQIVQVGPYPIASNCIRGGVEASVYGLTQELLTQGHEVHVFDIPRIGGRDFVEAPMTTNEARISTNALTVHRYANPGSHNVDQLKCVDSMVQDILALHADVVHIHGTSELSAAIYMACEKHGLKLMLTIHGLARVEKKNKLHQTWKNLHTGTDPLCKKRIPAFLKALYQFHRQSRIECNLLEHTDRAIVDTGYLLDALKEYPVKRLPELHVIPQGANEKFYDGTKTNVQSDMKTKTILCVGTFSRRKGQVLLIHAFELLRKKQNECHDEPVKLILCGVKSEADYYNEVEELVGRSDYRNDIQLHVDKSQEFLLEKYRESSVFALHSQEESQGIVLAEAMAMGLPVVSTRVGGIPYVVEDGVNGILTEYGDVEATANALDMLLTDKDLREKMAVAAIVAADNYRWENITEKISKLY